MEMQKIKDIFNTIDDNKNGFLEPFELSTVSAKLGKPMDKEQIEKCLKCIDSNGDG